MNILNITPETSLQEIFDFVVNFLYEQGEPARLSDGTCFYRGESGKRCAAGCLIPDDKYDPKFEGKTIYTLKGTDDGLDAKLSFHESFHKLGWTQDQIELISACQHAHDMNIEYSFAGVAASFQLNFIKPEGAWFE